MFSIMCQCVKDKDMVKPGLASLEDKQPILKNLTSTGEGSIQQYVRIFSRVICLCLTNLPLMRDLSL